MISYEGRKQTASGWKCAKRLGSILNWSGLSLCLLMLLVGRVNLPWVLSGFCFSSASLTVYLLYPQYYTLTNPQKNRYMGTARTTQLSGAIALPLCLPVVLLLRSFNIIDWQPLWLYGLIGGTLLMLFLRYLSLELREHSGLLVLTLLAATVGLYGILGSFNHIANTNPAPPIAGTILETDMHGRWKSRMFYCSVAMGDRRLELPLDFTTYADLAPGDRVWIVSDTGALGIEYAYLAGKSS